jgi:non-homologous end joining protein Ku
LKSFKDTYQERLLAMLKAKVAEAKKVEIETTAPVQEPKFEDAVRSETLPEPVTAKRKMEKAPPATKAEKKRKVA